MRFLALTLLPTGEPFDERYVDIDDLDQLRLRRFENLFRDPQISSRVEVPGAHPLQAQCTASAEGMALGTLWLNDQILHSTAMFAGRTESAESSVLNVFHSSIAGTRIVRELGGHDFAEFFVREERPVLFGVMWPIIPLESYEPFASADIYLAAAFFRVIGVERDG
jgi:hypothetical protein